ncbi:MAG: T9SS type A sorting domain-containing protein [Flavobacteriales bacterium]
MKATLLLFPFSIAFGLSASGQEIVPGETPGSTGSVSYGAATLVTVRATDGNVWLQQNLGAAQVGTSMNDAAAFGDLYQWGRWDDGHALRTSATANVATLSSSNPLGLGTGSPFFFIGANPADWWGQGTDADFWGGTSATATKGIDPCIGIGTTWHLPSAADWDALITGEGITGSASAFASNLKLVVAGSRDGGTGTIINAGVYGNYWSSTTSGVYAKDLSIGDIWVTPADDAYRGYGMSMRCLNNDLHTGIQSPDELRGLRIYPNPSKGSITVEMDSTPMDLITVYGADLRIIRSWKPNGVQAELSLSDVPNGTYGIQVVSGSAVSWRTVVVAH